MAGTLLNNLMQKINGASLTYTISICWVLFNITQAKAQFPFPSSEVLQYHHVKSMTVYKTALRFEGGPEKTQQSLGLDSTRQILNIFYFNAFGKLDSNVQYPTDSGFYQKEFFRYDALNNLVEYTVIDNERKEYYREQIEATTPNNFVFQLWEHGNLRKLQKINSDSLIYETQIFSPPNTSYSTIYTYDFQSNTRTKYWRNNKGEFSRETYQWFAENGNPKSFKHALEEKKDGKRWPRYKEKEYKLNAKGNVVNKYLGRFDDPYLRCNYYERFEKLKPIYYPGKDRFKADHLTFEKERTTIFSFDGVEIVYLYEIEYNYR